MEKHLHIISLTVPYPVNFGGVFDLFYKIQALHKAGISIHLHCFDYGSGEQPELNKYCCTVNYYSRNEGHKAISSTLPYIVASRKNEELFTNLLQDNYPILMEGIHCTYLLNDDRFKQRKKYVRLHNVEYLYYQYLFKATSSFFRKIYFYRESRLLKKYEASIASKATAFWAVSQKDVIFYQSYFNCTTINYLPVYLPDFWGEKCREGKGCYCLYHGDLSIAANEKTVVWLLQKVFGDIKLPLVIAGKNPSERLQKLAHKEKYTCMVANPTEKEMQDMITKAHINILPTSNPTGISIKLLNALFNGKYCITNGDVGKRADWEAICSVANSAEEFKALITSLYLNTFPSAQIEKRKKKLADIYNNAKNTQQIIKWVWGECN